MFTRSQSLGGQGGGIPQITFFGGSGMGLQAQPQAKKWRVQWYIQWYFGILGDMRVVFWYFGSSASGILVFWHCQNTGEGG